MEGKRRPYRGKVERKGLMIGMMVYLRDLNMVSSMHSKAKHPESFVLDASDGSRWKVTLEKVR